MSTFHELSAPGEPYTRPDTYPTPEEVGLAARANAAEITSEEFLNFGAAEMHMQAFVGLFNGFGNYHNPMFDRMPREAKEAARETSTACYEYFRRVGIVGTVIDEGRSTYPEGTTERDIHRLLLNKTQLHTGRAGTQETARGWSVAHSGRNPGGPSWKSLRFPLEDPAEAEADRLQMTEPYSVEGIRELVTVFGRNLGPVIMGFAEAADPIVSQRSIVDHAYGCLQAARIRPPEPEAGEPVDFI